MINKVYEPEMVLENKKKNFSNQYYAAVIGKIIKEIKLKFNNRKKYFIANILMISSGVMTGWTSPAIPFLESEETPLKSGPVTTEEISWIGANLSLGGTLHNWSKI